MTSIIQNEENINLTNNQIEIISNNISEGIITTDLSGRILTVNSSWMNMFGYSKNEIKKTKICNLIDRWNDIIEIIQSNKNFIDEDIYVNSRKNKLQYNVSAYPILDSEKRIYEIIFVFKEVKKTRKLSARISSGNAIYTFDKIIGKNKDFLSAIEYSKKISKSKSTILIMGESGTGKEVFAQSIHNYSERKDEAFVAVNCGAIPTNLIESELFGYEEGAFTGAKRGGCAGKFELSNGGTIFLDEIGEMPLDMQIKLLRVIEEKVITRIGGAKPIPINVRIIAATNKDLRLEAENGDFRKDLFYRLNVLPLYLPPLREKKDDIPLLIDFFMESISKRLNKKVVKIKPEKMQLLINYDWPGNIRELENVVELIINTEIIPHSLENEIMNNKKIYYCYTGDEDLSLEEIEKNHIIRVIQKYNGHVTLAAKTLRIGRNTLYRKIKKYNIKCTSTEQNPKMEQ